MSDFNPYVEWLGLSPELAEPNHYQVLGLPDFEADPARIAIAADKAMSRVRSFRPGPNAKAWSKLLDELLLAKGRLLDAERKQEYDADLRETAGAKPSTPKAESPASAPATSTAGDSAGWDPRFPPGMGPNVGKSPPKSAAPEPTQPAPEPVRAAEPAPAPTPAPIVAPAPTVPVAAIPNVPPTAWPTSMLHPVPHGAPAAASPLAAAPMAAPLAQPQPAPLAQPMYGNPPVGGYQPYPQQPVYPQQPAPAYPQPQYGQPQAYAQPGYAPQYSMPAMPAYPGPTYPAAPAMPYGAPQYPQPGYGVPPTPTPPPAEPPRADLFGSSERRPSRFDHLGQAGATAHSASTMGNAASAAPLDPMAPVAMPTALPGQDDGKSARVVGFAAAQQGQSAIPRGKAVSSAASAASSAAPATPAAVHQPTTPQHAAPTAAPMAPLAANSVESTVAAARLEKDKGDRTLFYVSGGAIVLLLGAIIFAVVYNNQPSPDLAENPNAHVPAEPHVPTPTPPVDHPKPEHPKPKPPVAVTPPENKPKPVEVKPITPQVPNPSKRPTPMPPEEMPNETKPIEPKPVEPKPVEPKPIEPKPPEPAIPVPMPPPPKPPEPAPTEVKLTPAELMALSQAMTSAKETLRERNFAETDKHLNAAKKLARSPDQLAKLNRLDVLTQYVKQFDRSLKTLMADENFDAGAELMMGTTRVVVVERSPTKIVIRINGQNREYALASMPDGLAMALIDLRLPTSDPVSKVIKASYLAAAKVPTEINQEKAKELFAQAVQEGVSEVADLPMVMTDTYDFKE